MPEPCVLDAGWFYKYCRTHHRLEIDCVREQLTSERDRLKDQLEEEANEAEGADNYRRILQEERDRYRKALEEILALSNWSVIHKIAEEALKGTD